MNRIVTSLFLSIFLSACSTKPPEDPSKKSPPKTPKIVGMNREVGMSFDAKQLANELQSSYVAEVRFKKGSVDLTEEAKRSLSDVITRAKKDKSIERAKLITWADQEMPSEKKRELSSDQVELAERRIDVLRKFIQNTEEKIGIDSVSMARRPGGLKKYIPNEATRIQESLERAGVPVEGERKNALGKASRSIVIFTRD